jgi:hypothetical protein
MLHGHDFNHVQIWLCGRLVDREYGINNVGGQLFGERAVDLGRERGSRDREEEFAVDFLGELELVKELHMVSESSLNKLSVVCTFSDSVFAIS